MSSQNAKARSIEHDEAATSQTARSAAEPNTLDVHEQIELLKQFETKPAEQADGASHRGLWSKTLVRRSVKTLIALALVAILGWTPLQRLLAVTSAEATVNARIITLRAPIDGRIVDWGHDSRVGSELRPEETILRIDNTRADRTRLDELRRSRNTLAELRKASTERLVELERLRAEQLAQFESFSRSRVAHIEARRQELLAEKEAAKARLELSQAALTRSVSLHAKGFQAQQAHDEAVRESKVRQAELAAVERRLDAAEIELAAARKGTFVTDGFNDIPRSAQRANELAQTIAELKVTMAAQDRRLATMQTEIREETERYKEKSAAVIASPTEGQVWEVLTSPGEEVHRGQELIRLLDCKHAVVTAAVSEANFNSLKIGDKASFRLRGASEDLPGKVIGLYGLASAPANLAINQSRLSREPYHAAVEVPALSTGDGCRIGRTGVVTFDVSSSLP